MAKDRSIVKDIKTLHDITSSSSRNVFGIKRDIVDAISEDVFEFGKTALLRNDTNKSLVNSQLSDTKMLKNNSNQPKENVDGLYDIIRDDNLVKSLKTVLGGHNIKFKQMIQDYEIVKRSIPQVHKVIISLKNNIKSPDSISKSALGIKMPDSTSQEDRDRIMGLIEKYELNEILDNALLDYLIISTKYLSVVPYSHIIDMLAKDKPIQECIDFLESETKGKTYTLLESVERNNDDVTIIQENANLFEEVDDTSMIDRRIYKTCDGYIKTILENIEIVDGGMTYYKNAILNEAITMSNSDESEKKAMKSIFKRLNKSKKQLDDNKSNLNPDGLLDDQAIEQIRKNVNFKGCHIEDLDPVRMIPFRMRGTLVGYFYADEKMGSQDGDINNSGVMQKINSTIYQRSSGMDRQSDVENMVIRTIGDKIMKAINSKFLADNMEDINVIYEFVKDNEIHKKGKRIIFFHPDDVVEIRRKDGSIMKNAMFMAKLFILTTLSNVLTNVTRGTDRNLYYVKTGLN